MLFTWNDQTIRWFLDASAYTGFHGKLAQRIFPYLEQGGTLCDLGCGLGRLDLEFLPYVSMLTAVDIEPKVLARLRRDAGLHGFQNLNIRLGDAAALTERFDVVLMSFFGYAGGNPEDPYRLCRRRLVRVAGTGSGRRLYPGRKQRKEGNTISAVQRELSKQGHDYKLITDTIEFGQPLRSWEEAQEFVRHQAPGTDAEEIDAFLRKNAVHTGEGGFPYYLSYPKEIGIFVIDTNSRSKSDFITRSSAAGPRGKTLQGT